MMPIRFDSTSARHKLLFVGLLLIFFVIPFALQWRSVTLFDNQAVLAGGTVLGTKSYPDAPVAPATNDIEQMSRAAGSDFVGVQAQ